MARADCVINVTHLIHLHYMKVMTEITCNKMDTCHYMSLVTITCFLTDRKDRKRPFYDTQAPLTTDIKQVDLFFKQLRSAIYRTISNQRKACQGNLFLSPPAPVCFAIDCPLTTPGTWYFGITCLLIVFDITII